MGKLFGRNAQVVFGRRLNAGKDVTGLRVKFKIEKTLEASPNKSTIQVFNLNEDSRGLTEKRGLVLILKVNYDDDAPEPIFSGDILRAFSELNGSDIVTTFENADGQNSIQNARMDVSYKNGTSIKDLFTNMIATLTDQKPDLSQVPDTKLQGSLALSGLSKEHLEKMCARLGLVWYINDGKVVVIPKGGNTTHKALLVSPDTGLIGIPKKKNGGVDLVMNLQPKVVPGRLIQVDSSFIKGSFAVQKVTHEGDTHGSEWYSTIEAAPVGGTLLNNAGKAKGVARI